MPCSVVNQIVITVVNPTHRPEMGWGLDPKYTVNGLIILLMLGVIFTHYTCDLYFLEPLTFSSIAVSLFRVLGMWIAASLLS